MYNENRIETISANIVVGDRTIIDMVAQKQQSGYVNVNINIQSFELYLTHRDECDDAIDTFKQHIEELI